MEERRKGNSNDNKMKIKLVIVAFFILLIADLVILFCYLDYKAPPVSTDNAYVDGRIHTEAPISGTVKAMHVENNLLAKKQ